MRCEHLRTPYWHMDAVCVDESDVAIQACTRIPARRLRAVLQSNGHNVGLAIRIQIGRNVDEETVVAVRPESRFLSVHKYLRLAHSSIEEQRGTPCGVDREGRSIPPYSRIRQSTRAPCLFRGLRLTVLRNGHALQVVVTVERPRDGPVVRDAHGLPRFAVVSCGFCAQCLTSVELPVGFEQCLRALCRYCRGAEQTGQKKRIA